MEAAARFVNRPPAPVPAAAAKVAETVVTARVQRQSLRVSSPADAAEVEAQRIAAHVVSLPAAATTAVAHAFAAPRGVHRASLPSAPQRAPAAPAAAQPAAGGQPLSAELRQFMEPRFGADFSAVRLHTDARAAQLNQQLQARAFTVGNQIHFAAGQFSPETGEGRELIAHELTHTIQQGAARQTPPLQRSATHVVQQAGLGPSLQREPLWPNPNIHPETNVSVFRLPAIQRQPIKPPKAAPKDKAIDVVEAIVHMMSNRGATFEVGPKGENVWSPRYTTEVTKTVQEPGNVALVWTWFRLAVNDDSIIANEKKVADAHANTLALFASIQGKERSAAKTIDLTKRYMAGYNAISQARARERVEKMTDAGVAVAEKVDAGGGTEDQKLQAGVSQARKVLNDAVGAARRVASPSTMAKQLSDAEKRSMNRHISNQKAYLARIAAGGEGGAMPWPAPVKRAHSMGLADGITMLKGGLDLIGAILAVGDPQARADLFRTHSNYFGTVAQAADINKVFWQFISGSIAVGGAGAYAGLRLAGRIKDAERFLDGAVAGVSNVGAALNFAGLVHGTFVLLDPEATGDEKAAAVVEVTSSAVGLAGFAAKRFSSLAVAAKWSGPISASLTINYYQFKYLAGLKQKARVGLSRLDWVYCHRAAKAAAIEAQKWQRRLAVTTALLAHEQDSRRQTELRKNADTYRYILIDQHLKPFVESRLASKTMDDDSATCGPAFNKRLKPVASQLGSAAGSDESALAAGAEFLNVIATALAEWDHIVMEGLD